MRGGRLVTLRHPKRGDVWTNAERLVSVGLVLALAGCSGGGGTAALPGNADIVTAPNLARGPIVDDWTTFAHDQQRTGFQSQSIGITSANVTKLTVRWTVKTGEGNMASPLVAGGIVYAASLSGNVRALDARTGTTRWTAAVGRSIQMTPTLADGLLFVGQHDQGGAFMALDAATGAVRWSVPFAGGVRAEPVVDSGVVYEGESGGDPSECNHGGIHAFSEQTGALLWTLYVDPIANDGGSVWAPLSFDAGTLYAGTGNSCSMGVADANSMIAVSPAGKVLWAHQAANPLADDDFGGGVLLGSRSAIALNKNGTIFSASRSDGSINWQTKVGVLDGYGGPATPSSDGNTIVVGAGYRTDPTMTTGNPGGILTGLDTNGNVLWTTYSQTPIFGSVSLANGLGFTGIDSSLVALDIRTGHPAWSAPLGATMYASPAVVPSGIYVIDDVGDITALALPATP